MNKTSIYIHIPYCFSKCRYCDFPSYAGIEDTAEEYFLALRKEISSSEYRNKIIDTVFFGGGTPSAVNEKYIAEIMQCINDNFILRDDCEITLEANPGTLTENKLNTYFSSGINRISMGMQSHDDAILRTLGRIHRSDDTIKGVELINKAGFTNYNLDVMFALPGQTVGGLEDSLRFAAELSPTHISAYSLIIEEGTPFYDMRDTLSLPDEETERKMYHLCKDILSDYGYERYEVSNYAKEDFQCRHNKFCWDYEDYIGFGSAAHSLIKPIRRQNTPSVTEYIGKINQSSSASEVFSLTKEDMISECIIMGLRKTEGVDLSFLRECFGYDLIKEKQSEIKMLREYGFADINNDHLFITEKGFDISDSITLKLI